MKVLVTGHEGYIGAELTPTLRAAGHAVVGVDTGYFREAQDVEASLPRRDVRDLTVEDLAGLLRLARPEVVYTHNLADKHPTHVAVALRTISALPPR